MDHAQQARENGQEREKIKEMLFFVHSRLIDLASAYGFEHNLWHNYLTFLLVNNENAYSTSCEIVGPVKGSINELAAPRF